MALLKKFCKNIILIIIITSLLITFLATPASYAKLDLKDGQFYYSGTTKGTYTAKDGIFSWLLSHIGDIADWIIGIITMGFRMVFVGWTALIEKLLTWALETTTGVSMAGQQVEDGLSSTDLTSITDSSNNLTVQAIVYNQVPVFNINFFDLEYDKTVSGTGQKYKCEKCNEDAEKCASASGCSCACNGKCDGCSAYIAALNIDQTNNPPVVVQIKNLVSMWYYIIRLIALAAMLVVLIAIGIKMAVSTIASDKAVYKRMLVDWVVGVIILFAIHYMMIFIIYINDSLVNIIKESASHINTVTMKELSETGTNINRSNEDIEVDVYEAVRTRAYDAKLSNGLSGMIMYMTLVYFAIRYTLVYIKRYLTLIVLTLMGPAVGIAYALQKVLNGKSSTLKTWTSEYIMNVIIQSVHALIYSVFISSALVLSLESISGIIVALILMNYSLKAEAQFRKIFKFGDGDSLVGHTAEAGSAEKMKQSLQTARGLYMGAKPLAQTMMNTPFAGIAKGIGKAGIAAGMAGAAAVKTGVSKVSSNSVRNNFSKAVDREMDINGEGHEYKRNADGSDAETEEQYESRRNAAKEAVLARNPKFIESDSAESMDGTTVAGLIVAGEKNLRGAVEVAASNMGATKEGTPEHEKATQDYFEAMQNYAKFKQLDLSKDNTAAARGERILDVKNHFKFAPNKNGSQINLSNLNKLRKGVFGTKYKDPKTGQFVSDKNGLYSKLSSENLLGFTEADKKVFKEQVLTPIKNGFGGMAAMFVGMGTLVAHPTMGMALLGAGKMKMNKTFKKPVNYKDYGGRRYGFANFSAPAMRDIQKTAVARANREMNAMLQANVKESHPELYSKLKKGLSKDAELGWNSNKIKDLRNGGIAGLTVGTLGAALSGAGISFVPMAAVAAAGTAARFTANHTGIFANMHQINKHSAKQMKKQQMDFITDGLNLEMSVRQAEYEKEQKDQEDKIKKEEFEKLNYEYDPVTGDIKKNQENALEDYNKVMMALYAEQGLIYDPKTGTTRPAPEAEDARTRTTIKKEQLEMAVKAEDGSMRRITDADVQSINKELDLIIESMLKKGTIDANSASVQNEMIKKLSDRLIKANILVKGERVEDVFKHGKNDLVDTLKQKANAAELKESGSILDKINELDKAAIQNAVESVTEGERDITHVKSEDVLAKLRAERPKQKRKLFGSKQDGSQVVNTSDGSRTAGTSDGSRKLSIDSIDDSKLQKAIQAYIKASDNDTAKVESKKTAKAQVDKKVRSRRRKLQQVLELKIDGLEEVSTDAVIDKVKNGDAKIKDGDKKYDLSQDESSDVLKLLLMRKELEEVNQYARQELELKSGNLGYTKKLKKKGAAAVEYYSHKLQIETYKSQSDERSRNYVEKLDSEIAKAKAAGKTAKEIEKLAQDVSRDNLTEFAAELERDSQTTPLRREDIYEQINKLNDVQKKQRDLAKKELAMKNAEKVLDRSGPIENVNAFIENLGKK